MGIWQDDGNAIKAADGGGSGIEQRAEIAIENQTEARRERLGNKGLHRLADGGDGNVVAGGSAMHGRK